MDRTFTAVDRDGKEVEFELLEPDLAREREAEMQRLKAYSEALKEGVLPREAMREVLRDKGVWADEEDREFTEYVRTVAKLEKDLRDAVVRGNNQECTTIAGQLSRERLNMLRSFMVANTVLMCSCEGFAEAIKLEAMMASCVVVKATKERYWESYKEYVLERDLHPTATVAIEAQILKGAIEEEQHNKTLEEYPEHKWLKKLNADLGAQIQSEMERARKDMASRVERAVQEEKDGDQMEAKADGSSDTSGEEGSEGGVEKDSSPSSDLDS